MKKNLLLAVLFLGSLTASAQLDCATDAIVLTTNGTYTAPDVIGSFEPGCYTNTTTSPDNVTSPSGTILGLWYKYTPATSGEITLTSDLAQNVAPFSVDTRLQVLTGTCGALVCYDASDDVSATNYRTTLTFPVAAGTTYYFQWDNYWNDAGFDFDFTYTPIACLKVYNVNSPTNTTTTSITLNWDASLSGPVDYQVEYGLTGFTQGSGTTLTTPTNSLSITGLALSTAYDYYVRSNCGTSQSSWTTVNSFTTAKVCPYANGLDTAASLIGWTLITNGPAGQGWNSTGTSGQASTPGYWIFASSNPTTSAANNNWLFSPAFSLQAGEQVTVSFYTRASTSARTLRVTAGLNNTQAAQTTQIAALNIVAGTTWNLNTLPVYTAPATGIYYFGFNDNSASTATAVNMRLDTFNFTSTLGTNDFISSKFAVYPNPVNDIIKFSNDSNVIVNSVEMSDLNGRVIKSAKINATEGQISLSDLSSGVYMMRITTDQGTATKKIVKQ